MRQTQAEGEAGSSQEEMGDSIPGSWDHAKADAQPLSHPGVADLTVFIYLLIHFSSDSFFFNTLFKSSRSGGIVLCVYISMSVYVFMPGGVGGNSMNFKMIHSFKRILELESGNHCI